MKQWSRSCYDNVNHSLSVSVPLRLPEPPPMRMWHWHSLALASVRLIPASHYSECHPLHTSTRPAPGSLWRPLCRCRPPIRDIDKFISLHSHAGHPILGATHALVTTSPCIAVWRSWAHLALDLLRPLPCRLRPSPALGAHASLVAIRFSCGKLL